MAINREKVLQEAQKLVEKKRFDKAIAEYQKVVAEDPSDVRTLLKIGDLYLKMEAYADAIATYERVGNYYAEQGFSVKAVAVYKQIREIIQKHAPHLEDRFGHIVPRLADLLASLDLRSDALAYYDELATRLMRLGRDRDAIDVFKKIVSLDPNNPVSHLRLADAFGRVRDVDSSVEEYARAADILVQIGRRDDALRVVERILAVRQEARWARFAAELFLDRAQPNDAMAALTKLQIAFKENPRDLETLGLLARAFELLGQPSKAVEVHKEAARIARESGQKEAFDELCRVLLAKAPNDEGVRQLVASELKPSTAPPMAAPVAAPPPAAGPAPTPAPPRPSPVAAPAEPEEEELEELDDELLVDEEIEEVEVVAEEEEPLPLRASYPPADEPGSQLRQLLAQADAARRAGDYARAAGLLQHAVQAQPDVRELRERLCDVLIEAGDQDAAVVEMLSFAARLVETGDPDAAARLLDEVLLLEPGNRPALEMLHALGYSVSQPEEQPSPSHAYGYQAPEAVSDYQTAPPPEAAPGYDPMAPLPSYDLEELTNDGLPLSASQEVYQAGGDAAAYSDSGYGYGDDLGARTQPPAPAPGLDDPFGAEATSFGAPLPSYEIEDEVPRPSLTGQLDESALEEIDFFVQQGMLDEAENLLNEQLARLPTNRLLLERKREIDLARAEAPGAPTSPATIRPEGGREVTVDRAYDIANALDAMDAGLEPEATSYHPAHQVSVETIFEQFKAGVAEQVAENDAATHYDLGVAYKEMGLVTDAISEFELASRDPTRECVAQSMIGMLHMQLGNLDAAIDAFIRGLHASQKTSDQEVALTYEIGNAYEYRSNPEQALYYFQLVARINPSHRDPRGSVAERIASLEQLLGQQAPPKPAPKAAAVGADDEFDAAFDDLFNPKG